MQRKEYFRRLWWRTCLKTLHQEALQFQPFPCVIHFISRLWVCAASLYNSTTLISHVTNIIIITESWNQERNLRALWNSRTRCQKTVYHNSQFLKITTFCEMMVRTWISNLPYVLVFFCFQWFEVFSFTDIGEIVDHHIRASTH